MKPSGVEGAALEYERILRGLSVMHEGVISPPARKWNRLFTQLDKPGRILRDSEQGRAFISALMGDPSVTVRLSAAAAALFWDESRAREVLGEIQNGGYALQSTSAKYVLIEFEKGHLSNLRPDWYGGRIPD